MVWTGQNFSVGQILTAAQMTNLQNDITALAVGDAGAPKIQAAAIDTDAVGSSEIAANSVGNSEMANDAINTAELVNDSVTSEKIAANAVGSSEIANDAVGNAAIANDAVGQAEIAANAVGQAEIANNAVGNAAMANDAIGQAELKTSTQSVSTSLKAVYIVTASGGRFSLYGDCRSDAVGPYSVPLEVRLTMESYSLSSSYQVNFNLHGTTTNATWTMFGRLEYIQASPPYDLGDGVVAGFIYATIDNSSGDIVGLSISQDPPWMHNGTTDTSHDYVDSKTGKHYKNKVVRDIKLSDALSNPRLMEEYKEQLENPVIEVVEITQDIKNADMNELPHPLMNNDLDGLTVVLLDPMSDFTHMLMDLISDSSDDYSDVHDMITKHVKLSSSPLNRCMPNGVCALKPNWRSVK